MWPARDVSSNPATLLPLDYETTSTWEQCLLLYANVWGQSDSSKPFGQLEFAFKQLKFDADYRKTEIFTNKRTFSSVEEVVTYCWRPANSRYLQQHTHERGVSGRVSTCFWGSLWTYGPGELVRINGRLTGGQYAKIRRRNPSDIGPLYS